MFKHRGPQFARNGDTTIIQCSNCHFAHQFPLPLQDEVTEYYDTDRFYSEHSPPGWLENEQEEYRRQLWSSYYHYIYSLLDHSNPTVIDIGCGPGWLISFLAYEYGLEVFGVEPSAVARSFTPTPSFVQKTLPSRNIAGNIILALVLEHLHSPLDFLLESVIPYLEGNLIIIVPNEFNPLQKGMSYNDNHWFITPVHINYFDPAGLRHLLEQAGLTVTHESATFPMEIWKYVGLDYRGRDWLGFRLHRTRLMIERLLGVRAFHIYNLLYNKYGIGRELIMVARKS